MPLPADFVDWTAEVEEVTASGKLSIIYRCGEYPEDPVGVTVRIPPELEVTTEWVRERMEANAMAAITFWEELDNEELMRGRRTEIQDLVGSVRVAGQTSRIPDEVPDGTPVFN